MMTKLENYQKQIEKCSHCSFCQSSCPAFLSEMQESNGTCSRMEIVRRGLIEKDLELSPKAKKIIDNCLLCTNCLQTCSARIPIDEIIIAARHEMNEKNKTKLFLSRLLNRLIQGKGMIGQLLLKLGFLAGKTNLLPDGLPTPSGRSFEKRYGGLHKAEGPTRYRAAYFIGCSTNNLDEKTGRDLLRVLTKNGVEVIVPKGLSCCGLPSLGMGDLENAGGMMANNIMILSELDVDVILTDCSSCGQTLNKMIPKIFDETSPIWNQVTRISRKTREVTEFLMDIGLTKQPAGNDCQYTYHVPCHQEWNENLADAPRKLKSQIPNTELVEMEHPDSCCGAAGTYFLKNRNIASKLRARKIDEIKTTGVDTVVSQCPSCRLYLNMELKGEKRIIHPISLLADAYEPT